MTPISNVQPLSPEALFNILKTEFPVYLDEALGSNTTVEFAHVADIINISFPEVITGPAYTLTVGEAEIEITDHTIDDSYNTELLEQHLIEFLNNKAR